MKKTFTTLRALALSVAITAAAVGSAAAQVATNDELDSRFRFGIKGGVNLSNLYSVGSSVSDNNVKPSFNAGVLVRTPLAAILGFQIEALYTVKGSKLGYNNSNQGKNSGTFNLGYIEVPAMVRIQVIDVFSIQAGAYGSYLTNVNVSKQQFNTTAAGADQVNINTDQFNTLDYGLLGGVEFNAKFFDLGLRYDLGLRQVGRTDAAKKFTGNGRNSAASLYVAFVF